MPMPKRILCGPSRYDGPMQALVTLARDALSTPAEQEVLRLMHAQLHRLHDEDLQRQVDAGEIEIIPVVNYGNVPDGTVWTTVPKTAR